MVFRRLILLVSAVLLLGVAISSTPADLADSQTEGNVKAGVDVAGAVIDFPEPATVALLGLGGLVLLPRRVRGR
jgi:hypothetical protein